MDELDTCCGRLQLCFESLSWVVQDIPKEDVSSCIVEEANEDGADAYGALVDVRLVS